MFRKLRSHRHWCALLTLLPARLRGTSLFQSGVAPNEDAGDRTDSACNEGEEEGIIHAQCQRLLSNAGMQSDELEMLTGLRHAGGGRVLKVRCRLPGQETGED